MKKFIHILGLIGLLCTLAGKSVFYLIDKVLSIFGMSINVSTDFKEWYDIAMKVILFVIIWGLYTRQRKQYGLFQRKIKALRDLRDIDVTVFTHQIEDLNKQNTINNDAWIKAFKKVNVSIGTNIERQAESLIEHMNSDLRKQQNLLNKILDEELK